MNRQGQPNQPQNRALLIDIAFRAMINRGLSPEFSPEAQAELARIEPKDLADKAADKALARGDSIHDLRELLWVSIDNDDSKDLDQLTVAEVMPGDRVKIRVAIADVDVYVTQGSALDAQAAGNTTSVYTPAVIFSMLPEKLSTDLTSLNMREDRLAMVVEMIIAADGALAGSDVYRALVYNHAKLAYNSLGGWLAGTRTIPPSVNAIAGLAENLRVQDQVAQRMKKFRHTNGALTFETIEARPVLQSDDSLSLEISRKNRASEMIENFMIAANGVTARFLSAHNYPSIRRVVEAPRRWDRIVELAAQYDFRLPGRPDPLSLEAFMIKQKTADLLRFPDLSLAVVKLMGAGEYVAEPPGDTMPDHFGLAARDYTHSTAPNRRYTDLITQRLLKAALHGRPSPYSLDELTILAEHCTAQENKANKVERQVDKAAAALVLKDRIGERFDALVTGASPKGTWVRLLALPVEGRLVTGFEGLDVGDKVRVQLSAVDVDQGFIDFKKSR